MDNAKLNEAELFAKFEQELAQEEIARESALKDAEISRRLSAYISLHEKEQLLEARKIAQIRERAMDRQLILGVSINTARKMYAGKFPIIMLSLPKQTITLLEEAFNCAGDTAQLSLHCSCLIAACSNAWTAEHKRAAMAQETLRDKRYEIPAYLVITGGGRNIEQMEKMLICWAMEYARVKERKSALENGAVVA